MVMKESIFESVKDYLGPSDDDDHFDGQIMEAINSTFQTLHQMGIGPKEGFYIDDRERPWSDYTTDGVFLHSVKTYMNFKVKMIVDPPTSSFVLESMKEQCKEFEWRNYSDAEFPAWK